jgi:hypothetical protein
VQQTTTGVVILLVLFEVRGQIVDACGQQRDLNFGRTRIALGALEIRDDAAFASVVNAISNSLSWLRRSPSLIERTPN